MFFTLSKTLGLLCYPLVVLVALFVLSGVARRGRPRLSAVLFWIALAGLYLLSTRPAADLLLLPLEQPFEHSRPPAEVDCVVVLGGTLDLGRSGPERLEFDDSADRFFEGVLLARRFPQALLILSGGTADLRGRGRREAPLLRDYAIRLGVEPSRIRIDDRSRNTHENAVETARLLAAEHRQAVVLITSAFHMRRSLGCFRRVGLTPTPDAVDFQGGSVGPSLAGLVPGPDNLVRATMAVREYIGLVAYRLKGYV